MRVDPRLMIEFAAVAEEASFAKAAARLRIAQPWLSARIRRLEARLGFDLLVRTTRRVSLTPQGEAFLAAAKAVAAATEAASALAARLQRQGGSVLRIGAAPYTKAIAERHEMIERFTALHPQVSLELETGWSLALTERLRQASIDLSFMIGAYDEGAFEGLLLRHYGVSLTMSPANRLAAFSEIAPEQLAGQRVQVFTRGLNPRLWDDTYAALIAARVDFREMPEMAEGAPAYVARDDVVAAFFDFGAPVPPGVVRIPLAAPERIPFRLLRRRGALNPEGEAFWTLARHWSAQ